MATYLKPFLLCICSIHFENSSALFHFLDLQRTVCQLKHISVLPGDYWNPVIIGSKALAFWPVLMEPVFGHLQNIIHVLSCVCKMIFSSQDLILFTRLQDKQQTDLLAGGYKRAIIQFKWAINYL